MSRLHRARLALLVAVALAGALVVTQLPLGELLSQRRQLAITGQQLAEISARNAALRAENAALRQPATIEAIAHQEYGLVRPGQLAFVILPPSSSSSASAISQAPLPRSDLVAGSAAALTGLGATSSGTGSTGPGVLGRTLQQLEFWRWAF